jgi:hypothetical protein
VRVKYESEDGRVSGYGDEGKAAVEAYEADPLSRFAFPWTPSGPSLDLYRADQKIPSGHEYRLTALLGSRLAPLVQELSKASDETWNENWRTQVPLGRESIAGVIKALEAALSETLGG